MVKILIFGRMDIWLHLKGNSATWTPKPFNTYLEKVKDLINTSIDDWDRQTISQTFILIEAEQIIQIPLRTKPYG
jgi:hypothetical protein